MANQKLRPVRLDQFKEQLDEVGASDLLPVNIAKGETVYLRLGFSLEREDTDEFMERIQSCKSPDEAALVLLDYNPQEDAKTALKRVHDAGHTSGTLVALFTSATSDLRERVGNLRPRR